MAKTVCDYCKKYKIILCGIIPFTLVLYLLYPQTNNIIQSELIVILVCITWYYAYQTRRLVDEQEAKKNADFWEKRIIEFYSPFLIKLGNLNIVLFKEGENGNKIVDVIDDLHDFFEKKKYMVSRETSDNIFALIDSLWTSLLGKDIDPSFDNFNAARNEVESIIEKELDSIICKIRKFYKY